MNNGFVTWLINEMKNRDWNNSDLARKAGIVPSTVSMIINGQNRPGFEFCVKVAKALNQSPEKVLYIAGLLPSKPKAVDTEEIDYLFRQLDTQKRELAVKTLRAWVEK